MIKLRTPDETLFDLPAPQVAAILVRTTRSAELPVQVEAAIGLAYEHWYVGRSQSEVATSLRVDRKTIKKQGDPAVEAGLDRRMGR